MLKAIIIDTETGKVVNTVPDSDVILALGINGKEKESTRVFSGGGIPFKDYINAVAMGAVQSVLHEVPRREKRFILNTFIAACRLCGEKEISNGKA